MGCVVVVPTPPPTPAPPTPPPAPTPLPTTASPTPRLLLRPWGLAWSVTRCTVLAPQLYVRATSAVLMDPLVPPPRTPSRNVRSPKLWIARRLELSLYRIVENGLWPVPAGLEQRPPKLPMADEQRG